MVAGKTEFLDDTEVYKRLLETRKCFQGKGDIDGDRFDAVLLYAGINLLKASNRQLTSRAIRFILSFQDYPDCKSLLKMNSCLWLE